MNVGLITNNVISQYVTSSKSDKGIGVSSYLKQFCSSLSDLATQIILLNSCMVFTCSAVSFTLMTVDVNVDILLLRR